MRFVGFTSLFGIVTAGITAAAGLTLAPRLAEA